MKYIEDVDTGEIFPVEDKAEQEIEIPAFVKDNFPEMKVNYSGENGANDIILDLSHQLKEEKSSKTVYHKFPIMKILCAVIVTAVVVVVGVFGVRFATSVNFEPITIGHTESSVKEEPENQEENIESEKNNEDSTIISEIISILPIMFGVSITITGIQLAVKFMRSSIQ